MNDQTVTPPWTMTRVSQVDGDGREFSLTRVGKSEPVLEIATGDRTTLNTALTVNGPLAVTQAVTATAGMEVSGGKLTASGGLNVTGAIEVTGGITGPGMLPKGTIIMWAGDPKDVPAGWALCDGGHGTPDMRARFPVGADGGWYVLRQPGGSASHNHVIAHDMELKSTRSADGEFFKVLSPGILEIRCATQHSSHLPPFMPVHFLMKL